MAPVKSYQSGLSHRTKAAQLDYFHYTSLHMFKNVLILLTLVWNMRPLRISNTGSTAKESFRIFLFLKELLQYSYLNY